MVAERFKAFGTTIFTEMTLLAQKHGAVNLAQGFPDFDGPEFAKRAAAEAMGAGQNQYARMFGLPVLNRAIAGAWKKSSGIEVDPDVQVTVTSGCTEAIAAAMLGLVNPGDEVILFEPYYDSYRASVVMAGGVARCVALRPGRTGFEFDERELRSAFTPRTRAILVNTPHNPTGKVFTREELGLIAELCVQHGVIAITDEVYERLTYDAEKPHVSLATLDGMRERTLTLSSLGKTFSLTGWKIGWAIGTAELTRAVRSAHQFLTFSTATPLQVGAAAALSEPEGEEYVRSLVADLTQTRGLLSGVLQRLGFEVHAPAGAYFVMANWTRVPAGKAVPGVEAGARLGDVFSDDVAFCRYLTEHAGVAAIPPSGFYERREFGRSMARFAFCKKQETVRTGVERLEAWLRGERRRS